MAKSAKDGKLAQSSKAMNETGLRETLQGIHQNWVEGVQHAHTQLDQMIETEMHNRTISVQLDEKTWIELKIRRS